MDTSAPKLAADSPAASSPRDRWEAKPLAAGMLRAAILLAPLVASSGALLVVSHLWRAPAGGRDIWLAVMAVVAVVVAFAVERGARRLLPLASLLRLTMLFPDQAPSRLRIARSAGTTGQQLARLARSDDDTAQIAAEKVLTLITALGDHDRKTRGHSERVRLYCDLLAEELRLSRPDRDRLRWASLLHDIGKLEIAPAILNKPAKLSNREFARIRQHPTVGAEISAPLLPWLGEWGGGIVDHHERWDGHGYPDGRAGSEISRGGRIVGLVDAFETMTAARVYKKAMTTRAARTELAACAGTQFDPDYVRTFLAISLPRVLWAMGPLAFLVQLPFLRNLAKLGSQATQISVQGASTAGAAAAAGVIGVVSSSALAAHAHPHPHSHAHSTEAAATVSGGGGLSAPGGGAGATGAGGGTEPVSDRQLASENGVRPGQAPPPSSRTRRHHSAATPVAVPHQGRVTGSGPSTGTGTGDPLSIAALTAYVVQNQSVTVNVLAGATEDLQASTLGIATSPSDGTATVGAAGAIDYQPQNGFHGVDQLVYDVCNAAGKCGSAALTINVLQPGQSNSDYSGVDFAGFNLKGFDFSGATLRGTDFSGANLNNVNFSNADLTGADLSSASLTNVIANGANLSGANLSGVTGGAAPQIATVNLTATIGHSVTINVASLAGDPDVPIDWSTLQITKQPGHGTARITGPHTIVYTPAAGILSVDQVTFSVANVLTFGASGSQHIAVVL